MSIKLKNILLKKCTINEELPPMAINRSHSSFSSDFLNYIKSIENNTRVGFKNGKWYPHKSPEGGFPTIGYGHKIKSQPELKKYTRGISDKEAEELLNQDLMLARKIVYEDIQSMFGVQIPLDKRREEILVDFAFNLGTLKKFPKLTGAVLNNDWDIIKREYKRYFKQNGKSIELFGRNQQFSNRYLKNLKEIDLNSGNMSKIEQISHGLIDDGVKGYTLKLPGAMLKYEIHIDTRPLKFTIDRIVVEPQERGKGLASALLNYFFEVVKFQNGYYDFGHFSDNGEYHLKQTIQRLAQKHQVRIRK